MNITTITSQQVRDEQVALWGERKVVQNEMDILRRFGKNAGADLHARYSVRVG